MSRALRLMHCGISSPFSRSQKPTGSWNLFDRRGGNIDADTVAHAGSSASVLTNSVDAAGSNVALRWMM